jgi:hypothetical protein
MWMVTSNPTLPLVSSEQGPFRIGVPRAPTAATGSVSCELHVDSEATTRPRSKRKPGHRAASPSWAGQVRSGQVRSGQVRSGLFNYTRPKPEALASKGKPPGQLPVRGSCTGMRPSFKFKLGWWLELRLTG